MGTLLTQISGKFATLAGEDRFLIKSAIGGLVYKVASIACSIATTAIAARLLGREDLGIWLALTAVTSWISLADGGIGQSLLNRLSFYFGQNDKEGAINVLWSGQWLQFILTAGLSILVIIISINFDISSLIFSGHISNNNTQKVFIILAVGTLLILPLRNFSSLLISHRFIKENTLLAILQSVSLTIASIFALHFHLGIIGYAILYLAAFFLVTLVGWVRIFKVHLPSYWKPLTLNLKLGAELLKSGIFFALSSMALILNSSFDNVILAKFYGPGAVVDYNFPVRLYGFTLVVAMLAGGNLASAYTQALGRNDIAWIRKRYRGSMIFGGSVSLVLCLALIPFTSSIIRVWSVGTSKPDLLMIVSVACWFTVTGFYQPTAFLMNGLYRAKDTLKVGILSVLINIPATLIGLKMLGPAGAPIGSGMATLLAGVFWSHHLCKKAIDQEEANCYFRASDLPDQVS